MSVVAGGSASGHLTAELRRLLGMKALALGVPEPALEALIRRNLPFIVTDAGEAVAGAAPAGEAVRFVVRGFVKIVCAVPGRRRPLVMRFLGPGEFVCVPVGTSEDGSSAVGVVAHTDATLASFATGHVRSAFGPDLQKLAGRSWASGVRLALDKTVLLGLPLAARVIHALRGLVPSFGRRQPEAWLLDLPLIHADVADLVAATRSNVTRCLVPLMRAGVLDRVHRRFLLRDRFMTLGLGSLRDDAVQRPVAAAARRAAAPSDGANGALR